METQKLVIFLILVLTGANVAFLDWHVLIARSPEKVTTIPAESKSIEVEKDQACTVSCLAAIREATASIALATPYPAPSPLVINSSSKKQEPREYYVPLGGGGSTTKLSWVDIPVAETYIDTAKYPSKITVTWDAFLKILSGNGMAYARLINVTDNQVLTETEISGSNENGVHVQSQAFDLISGNKLYRVQMKTNTGYEATITSGRIKIVTE